MKLKQIIAREYRILPPARDDRCFQYRPVLIHHGGCCVVVLAGRFGGMAARCGKPFGSLLVFRNIQKGLPPPKDSWPCPHTKNYISNIYKNLCTNKLIS